MADVIILGMPVMEQGVLAELNDKLRNAVAGVRELGVPKSCVSVFFVADLLQEGLGEELKVKIEGIYEAPGRTTDALRGATSAVLDVLVGFKKEHLPQCKEIEVRRMPMLQVGDATLFAFCKGPDPDEDDE